MTATSSLEPPCGRRSNASLSPSGDQTGLLSQNRPFVTRLVVPASAFTSSTELDSFAGRSLTNASQSPAGDQASPLTKRRGSRSSGLEPPPPASATAIVLPNAPRFAGWTNAILRPSGDQVGSVPSTNPCGSEPSASATLILGGRSPFWTTNATRRLSGDHEPTYPWPASSRKPPPRTFMTKTLGPTVPSG